MGKRGPRKLPEKGPNLHGTGARGGLRVYGVHQMLKKLKAQSEEQFKKSTAGIYKAALLILREATLITPIDLGNLRASGFIIVNGPNIKGTKGKKYKGKSATFVDEHKRSKTKYQGRAARMSGDHAQIFAGHEQDLNSKTNPIAVVGFSAFYAVYVHEIDLDYNRGEYRFLAKAINRNLSRILDVIKKESEI